MIKSMTGFASLSREDDRQQLSVTVKSVNHRYLDVQIRAPQGMAELEQGLRSLVQTYAARGRVELGITMQHRTAAPVTVELNEPLASALSRAAGEAQSAGLVEGALTSGDLFRFPQVLTLKEEASDDLAQHTRNAVMKATEEALGELDRMRCREGEFLARDLEERSVALNVLVDGIVAESESGDAALRERLVGKVVELEDQLELDPAAVAQEVIRWAARSDIHEEVARLRGHLEHMKQLSDESAPCGRKLDFLVQEMNREVNTVGSKAEGRGMTPLVVAAKAEIEKLREQIQNVE